MRTALLMAAALAASASASARDDDPAGKLRAAAKYAADGDAGKAADAYDKARAVAKRPGDKLKAMVGKAVALGHLGKPNDAIAAYRDVLVMDKQSAGSAAAAAPAEFELACNNLGVLHMREKQWNDAVAAYQQVKRPANPDAFVFHYNYGRALHMQAEKQKKSPVAAYEQYWKAVELQPAYDRAADRIAEILIAEPAPRQAEMRRLIVALTPSTGPQLRRAEKHLTDFLNRCEGEPAGDLRAAVLRYFAAVAITPAQYRETHRVWLAQRGTTGTALVEPLDRIFSATDFAAPQPHPLLFHNANEVREALPAWSDWLAADAAARRDVAALLTAAGADPATPAAVAVAKSTAAFALDPATATAAALRAADLLFRNVGGVDPNNHAVFDRYTHVLYDGKVDMLREALKTATPDREAWVRVYSFRVVLADLYARRKWWGNKDDFRTVLGQLRLAEEAEGIIRRLDPTFPASPLLPSKAGEAYAALGKNSDAAEAFARAADRYVRADNAKAAREIIAAARPLAEPTQRRRLDDIESLARVKGRAFPVDATSPAAIYIYGGATVTTVTGLGPMTYDLRSGRPGKSSLKWNPHGPIDMVALAGGKAAYSSDGMIYDCSPSTAPRLRHTVGGPTAGLWLADDGTLAVADAEQTLHVYPGENGGKTWTVPFRTGWSAALAGDGDALLTGGSEYVELWKAGKSAARYLPATRATAVALSHDDRFVLAGTVAGQATVWAALGTKQFDVTAGPVPVTAVAFARDGQTFATGDAGGEVRLWHANTGRPIGALPSGRGRVVTLTFSTDGRTLAAGLRTSESTGEIRTVELPAAK